MAVAESKSYANADRRMIRPNINVIEILFHQMIPRGNETKEMRQY